MKQETKPQKTPLLIHTPDPTQQYKAARELWNRNARGGFYSLVVFQIIAAVSTIGFLGALAFAANNIQADKYRPYLIERDAEGNYAFKGMLAQATLPLNDALVRNSLKTFVSATRQISSDPVVTRLARWNSGYCVTDTGRGKLQEYLSKNSLDDLVSKQITVDIQFDYYNHVAEKTWLVHWTEIISKGGVPQRKVPMTGTFTFVQLPAPDENYAENNPWGIYYTDFFITEAQN